MGVRILYLGLAQRHVERAEELLDQDRLTEKDIALAQALATMAVAYMALGEYPRVNEAEMIRAEAAESR